MVKVARKIIDDVRPNEIIYIGDQVDYAPYSSHGKRKNETPSESIKKDHKAANEVLDELAPRRKADLVWIDGNHEERQEDFFTEHSELYDDAIHRYNVLSLAKRGFSRIIPFGGVYKSGKLHFVHGWRAGVSAVRAHLVNDYKANFVMGHIHKSDTATSSNIQGNIIQGYSIGCMSRLKFRYAHHPTANHGLGVYYILPNGNFTFHNIVAINASFIYQGQLYKP
jgi:hypothetical protein